MTNPAPLSASLCELRSASTWRKSPSGLRLYLGSLCFGEILDDRYHGSRSRLRYRVESPDPDVEFETFEGLREAKAFAFAEAVVKAVRGGYFVEGKLVRPVSEW